MASPSKRRRKNTPTTPQQSRNLDFYFRRQRQAPPKPNSKAASEGPTGEEYARKLTEEWAREDVAAVGVPEGSRIGVGGKKRRRSSSPAVTALELNGVELPVMDWGKTKGEGDVERVKTPEGTVAEQDKQTILAIPPTPKKTTVTLEAALERDALIEDMPFDKDPLSFDPDLYKGIVSKWPAGKAPYALLTKAFVLVNSTRSRIKIVGTLVNLIRTLIRLDPESLLAAVCFLCPLHSVD